MMDLWELPQGWGWETIDDLSTQVTDGTHKTPDYVANGVRFISIQNIRRFQPIDWGGYVRYVSRTEHEELIRRVKPEKDDILVSKIGTLGVAKVIDFDEEVSIFVGLALIKPDRTKLLPRYLEAVLNSPSFVQLAYRQARGAGRKTLPLIELKKFQIPIPFPHDRSKSIETQRQIVARIEALLSEVREMREINQRIIGDAASLLKASLVDVFKQAPQKGWIKYAFGDLVDNFDGRRVPLKKGDRLNMQGSYPYYGATGIIDQVNRYLFDGEFLLVSEDGANLVVRKYPIAFIATGQFWVNNHAHVVQANQLTTNRYLAYAIEGTNIRQSVTGAAQPKLNQAKLNQIPIWLPRTKDEQDYFVRYFEEIEEQSKEMLRISEQNENLLSTAEQSILAQAFRGELI